MEGESEYGIENDIGLFVYLRLKRIRVNERNRKIAELLNQSLD